tara:strand:+ start:92 stop:493 length:402 start_codon:yes stop_codon:yes gene_type:complete
MKFILGVIFVLFNASYSFSQIDNTVLLDSIQSNNDETYFYFSTNESFIAGANSYVLHIGAKPFLLNEHPNGNLSRLIFKVPTNDFEALKMNAEIVLVYGFYHSNTQQDGEGNLTNGYVGMHWILGQLQDFKNK